MNNKLIKGQILIKDSTIGTSQPEIFVVSDVYSDVSITLQSMPKGKFTIDPSKDINQFNNGFISGSPNSLNGYSHFYPMFAGSKLFEFTQPGTRVTFNNKINDLLIHINDEEVNSYNRYDMKYDSEIIGYFYNETTKKYEIVFSTSVEQKYIARHVIPTSTITTPTSSNRLKGGVFSIPLDQINEYLRKNQHEDMNYIFDDSAKRHDAIYFVVGNLLVTQENLAKIDGDKFREELENNSENYPIQFLFDSVINLFDKDSLFSLSEINHLILPIFEAFERKGRAEDFFDQFLSLKSLSKLNSAVFYALSDSFRENKKTDACLSDKLIPNAYIEKLGVNDIHSTVQALWLKFLGLSNEKVKNEKTIERVAANLYKIFSYSKNVYYNDQIKNKLDEFIKNSGLSSKRYFKLIDSKVWDDSFAKSTFDNYDQYEDQDYYDDEDEDADPYDDEYEDDDEDEYEDNLNYAALNDLNSFQFSVTPQQDGQLKFTFRNSERQNPVSNSSLKFGDMVNIPMKNPYNYAAGFISRADQIPRNLTETPVAAFEHLKFVGVSWTQYIFEIKPDMVNQFADKSQFVNFEVIKNSDPNARFDQSFDKNGLFLRVDARVIQEIGLPLDTSKFFANPANMVRQPFNYFSPRSFVQPDTFVIAKDVDKSDATNSSQVSFVNKQNVATLEDGIFQMLKSDAKSSAYRIAADQVKKLTKSIMLNFVSKSNTSQASAWSILLDTEVGDVFVFELLGYTLTYAPKIKDHYAVQELAKELRISGMATAGNMVASSLMKSILPEIGNVINNLPMLAESRAEAESLAANQEQVILENVSLSNRA